MPALSHALHLERKRTFACKYMAALSGGVVVSIDASGFSEQLVPLYGYSPVGTQCIVKRPGSWKHTSLLMAIFSDGRPPVYTLKDGSINMKDFSAFVRSLPVTKKDTLVIDNASTINPQANTATSVLNTPAYSPECNPIELSFAAIKHWYRLMHHQHRGCHCRGRRCLLIHGF